MIQHQSYVLYLIAQYVIQIYWFVNVHNVIQGTFQQLQVVRFVQYQTVKLMLTMVQTVIVLYVLLALLKLVHQLVNHVQSWPTVYNVQLHQHALLVIQGTFQQLQVVRFVQYQTVKLMLTMVLIVFVPNVIQITFKTVLVLVNYALFICLLVYNAHLNQFALIVIIQFSYT